MYKLNPKLCEMDTSELKYPITFTLSGTFEIIGPKADYSKILKRTCCLAAMHITSELKFTKQTQYLIASVLHEKTKSTHFTYDYAPDTIYTCSVNIKGFTEYAIEKNLDSKNIYRREYLKYYMDDITLIKISYDLNLNIAVFDESRKSDVQLSGYVALVPELDDYLIEFFKKLQQQFALNGYDDMEVIKSFICADINTLGGKQLYMHPPLMYRLTAALETKLNLDLGTVD